MLVVGSITRSGLSTTQPAAITKTRRMIAARPVQSPSNRSNHPDGLSPLAKPSPCTPALSPAR